MKQTAVEWLYERFLFAGYAVPSEWKEKAKEMEKEQMKDTFTDTHYYTPFDSHVAFEEYYKEVYEGE